MFDLFDKILIWLIVVGLLTPLITHGLRSIAVVSQKLALNRDIPALLFSGVINLLGAWAVIAWFTTVTWIGLLLSFAVVVMVSHYFYKVVIQTLKKTPVKS